MKLNALHSQILNYLASGPKTFDELWCHFKLVAPGRTSSENHVHQLYGDGLVAIDGDVVSLVVAEYRLIMGKHCCKEMEEEVERVCEQHPDRFDCPDCFINFSACFEEYGLIIHDGGSSSVQIRFCPWCGQKLPESKRE